MVALALISKGIEFIVKGIDNLAHSTEHCKKRVDDLMSSYQSALNSANSNAKTVESLSSRYEKLSAVVNSLDENVSLSTDEYSEYNDIVNQIADMFPTLIQGYTSEGNAILSLKGNVEELRDTYKEAQQEAYNMLITSGKDSDGNDIINQWKNTHDTGFWADLFDFGADDVGGGISVSEALEQLKTIQNMSVERYREIKNIFSSDSKKDYDLLSDSEKKIGYSSYLYNALGLDGNMTDEAFAAAQRQAKALVQTYQAEINSALSDVQTLANAYLMTNEDYAKLDNQSQNAASIIVNSIDEGIAGGFNDRTDVSKYVNEIVDVISKNPDVRDAMIGLFSLDTSKISANEAKSLIDIYIESIAKELGEDELELKIRLGFGDTDDAVRRLQNSIRTITDDHGQSDREEYAALSEFTQNFTQAQIELWLKSTQGAENAAEAVQMYKDELKKLSPVTDTSISQTIDRFNTRLTPAFDSLKSAYQNIFTTDGFNPDAVDISMLAGIKSDIEALNNLEDAHINIDMKAFDNFVSTLTNTNTTEEQARQAFNNLATSIFYATNSTEGMTGETQKLVEQLLTSLYQLGCKIKILYKLHLYQLKYSL